MSVRYTAVLAVETPRGIRYKGVSYEAGGRTWRAKQFMDRPGQVLPRKAVVCYQTRLHVREGQAYEQARTRTIAHNLRDGWTP